MLESFGAVLVEILKDDINYRVIHILGLALIWITICLKDCSPIINKVKE
jgi:hypothetical protein